jgi:hypothetical protein
MGNFVDFDLLVAEDPPMLALEANDDCSLLAEYPGKALIGGICWLALPASSSSFTDGVLIPVGPAPFSPLILVGGETVFREPAPAGVVETSEANTFAASITFSVLLSDIVELKDMMTGSRTMLTKVITSFRLYSELRTDIHYAVDVC